MPEDGLKSPTVQEPEQPSRVGGLFTWIPPALKARRTWKTWARCCVALCATMILLVDNVTLQNMGQAAFFSAIVAVMLPPSLAFSLFAYAVITLLLGMMIGWAWGAAAMASGLSVRSKSLLARQQQNAQASLVPGIDPNFQFQKFIFQGLFLDPRSSAVYGAFFFIGTFALGSLRAFIPKLALLSIFGSIVLDVICTYGPSFPTAQYTIPKMFIIPTCYYVAIALASLAVIFPESLNHVWLTTFLERCLTPMRDILSIQSEALSCQPSDTDAWNVLHEKGRAARHSLVAGTQVLLGQIPMVDLELSLGRLGPSDLKRINGQLRFLMARAAALHAFQVFVKKENAEMAKDGSNTDALSTEDSKAPDSHQIMDRMTLLQRQIRQHEIAHGHDMDVLVPILQECSADLRNTCQVALDAVVEWIQDCNARRWARFFMRADTVRVAERNKKLVEAMSALQNVLDQFRNVERVKLIKPFEQYFDSETGQRVRTDESAEIFAARSLFTCFVFSYALDAFADRLIKFMAILLDIDGKRPHPRLWFPSGFGKLGRKIMSKRDIDETVTPLAMGTSGDPVYFAEQDDDDDESDEQSDADDGTRIDEKEYQRSRWAREEEECTEPKRRNPDALPPETAMGRFFLKLGSILKFFKSAEGIFALRHAVVSVALWIPSVCETSAWFYYQHRGLWALIMAQTGLAVYAGDQISGLLIRLFGTALGLLLGMAVWYMGAGHGNGNPYGIVVATTAFVAPFLLARIAAPPHHVMLWTMGGVTIVFVVGYSWIDTHLPLVANAGIGVELGWRRALLVIIGFTAGAIVMLFPSPTSSRTLVRKTLAATIGELGHILSTELEALLAEEMRAKRGDYENVAFVGESGAEKPSAKERRVKRIAEKMLVVAARLQGLAPSLTTARFEPQVSGIWPHAKYEKLYATQINFLSSLYLFTGAFARLGPKWCSVLVLRTPYLNPNLLSDLFSNISILSYALSGGLPLPSSLPKLRDRVVYHENIAGRTRRLQTRQSGTESRLSDPEPEISLHDFRDISTGRIDGPTIGFEELSLDILLDEQLPTHSTALLALANIINLVDEIAVLVKELCGETSFRGFQELQRDFMGMEEKAVGGGLLPELR